MVLISLVPVLTLWYLYIIIIIIILGISFIQSIYTYIPETNHVPTEHCVAPLLVLLFMVLISPVSVLTPLYLYVSTFRSTCAVPNMAVFCSSLTSWFPVMLHTYFSNDFEMVPVAHIITGITFVLNYHHHHLLLLLLLFLSQAFLESRSRGISYMKYINGRWTGLVTFCVETAFYNGLLKERYKGG
jgi:hypothetical protein